MPELGDQSEEFKNMLMRDERRFHAANVDKDGKLSFDEFATFVHPENVKHMEEIVVLVGFHQTKLLYSWHLHFSFIFLDCLNGIKKGHTLNKYYFYGSDNKVC